MPRRSKYEGKFRKYQVIGEWTVVQPKVHMDKRGRAFVKCKCSCGQEEMVSCHHLVKGRSTRCKKCNYSLRETSDNPHWKGVGTTPQSILTKTSSSAMRSNRPFDVTTSYVNDLYENSGQTCFFTGMNISHEDDTARLVELDKDKGYIEGNVAWVHRDIAPTLQRTSPNEFIRMCTEVANRYKPQEESHERKNNTPSQTKEEEKES